MAITDYTTLKTAIADWSHRADLTSYLDTFISLAEERLANVLRVRELEATATGTLSGITLALPTDFAELRRFVIDTTYDYCPEFTSPEGLKVKGDPTSGLPTYASIVGSNIEFNRTPDSAYAYNLDYWKKPTAITSTNTTSTLLTNYPNVYLFACLTEVAIYTKNDADIARYTNRLNELVSGANGRGKAIASPMRVTTA